MQDRFNILKSDFFYLLCLMIAYTIGSAFFSQSAEHRFYLSALFSLVILACIYALAKRKYLLYATLLLGTASLCSHWVATFNHINHEFYMFFFALNVLFLIIITYFILYSITLHQRVNADSLMGAICGYFLIGFIWSNIYLLIATWNPDSFSHPLIEPSLHLSAQHAIYFSFTTMTTLGYGDILPISNMARTFAWLEAVVGQIYLAVWIAQLVGLQISQK